MTIAEIAQDIKEFTEKRNWKNDNPSHLLVALNVELAELGEHFLWKSKFDDDLSDEGRKKLGYEIIDVLIYLLQIANKSGIDDLGKVYQDKIKKLAIKYPVDMEVKDWHKRHQEYKNSGKNELYE